MGQSQDTVKCTNCEEVKKCKLCTKCNQMFCQKCLSYPLIFKIKQQPRKQFDVVAVCQNCFKKNIKLNFDTYYTIIGQQNSKSQEMLFLHGGGSSRAMFESHAKILASQYGFRCILIDFPGHGSLMNQNLTLQACLSIIEKAVKEVCKKQKVYIIGGSFGGYLGMQALGKYPDLFKGAVIMMCGQNIGQGRGKMARFGLWAMQKSTTLISEATTIKQMIKIASSNKNLDMDILQPFFECGMYFKKSKQQIDVLKSTNSAAALRLAKCPVLFLNGEKDHRDSQQKWLQSAPKGSKLKVYKDTDHFFSHDKRYYQQVIKDISTFFNEENQKMKQK